MNGKATLTQDYQSNLKTQRIFLSKFKLFPDKTRKATYRDLLALPLNAGHFAELSKPYKILPEHGLNKQVAFLTEALGTVFPDLQNQLVPSIIHPFVRLFQEDCLFGFECSMTFLLNWLHPVLIDYPNPPKKVMELFEEELPKLNQKVNSFDYPLSAIIQPMFVVSLTDVLNKRDWLELMDFLVTNAFKPELYISSAIAIVKSVEENLIKLKSVEEISVCLRREKNLSMGGIIGQAKQLGKKYEKELKQIYCRSSFPLPKGRYPVYRFVTAPIQLTTNKYLAETESEDIRRIDSKFNQLRQFMDEHLKEGRLFNDEELESNYMLVVGQMRQYLEQIKKDHQHKMIALQESEAEFNQRMQGNWNSSSMAHNVQAIEQKAQLQTGISNLKKQANSIKAIEEEMLRRISKDLQFRKEGLKGANRKVKVSY